MQDGFKPSSSGRIGENPLAQARAMQSAVAVEAVRSEFGHDIDQGGLAGFDQLTGDQVGIDDRYAVPRKSDR